jgi:hypothetical protein
MVTVEGAVVETVYEIIHLPDDSVHGVGLKVPPAPLSVNDNVPEGVIGELDVSMTVPLIVTTPPAFTVAGLGLMMTLDAWIFTVRETAPATYHRHSVQLW